MAPETMTLTGYGLSVDYFSLGVMIFELLHGSRPWKNIDANMAMSAIDGELDPLAQVKRACDPSAPPTPHKDEDEDDGVEVDEIRFSSRLSSEAKSLLIALLEFKPSQRLGAKRGWEEVKAHPFFHPIDWAAMQSKSIKPPFQPDLTHANCTPDADLADQLLDKTPKRIRDEEQKVFDGWSWNTKIRHDETLGGLGAGGAVKEVPVGAGVGGVGGEGEVKEVKEEKEKKEEKEEEGQKEEVKAASTLTSAPSNPSVIITPSPMEDPAPEVSSIALKNAVEEKTAEAEAVEEVSTSPVVPVTDGGEVIPISIVSPLSPASQARASPSPRAISVKQSEGGGESPHRRSVSTGTLSLQEGVGGERGGSAGEGREKRRSTLKEKRQLHPMVSSEHTDHTRTASNPAVFPII